MPSYYPAEALADSPQPFTHAEVCQISARCNVPTEHMGVKRFHRDAGLVVYRLFAIGTRYENRTEAYRDAGNMGARIAIEGGLMPGFGQVCVLEHYLSAHPGMEHNTEWNH